MPGRLSLGSARVSDSAGAGNRRDVPTLEVQPRQTPEERDDTLVAVDVDDALTVLAETIEEWVTPRQGWEFTLREGHDFGRANNVEGRLLFVAGEQTCSLTFRLEQLDAADDLGGELVLRFEEREGIAKLARLTANGLDLELFHILTYT
jgi:hypothetical protein